MSPRGEVQRILVAVPVEELPGTLCKDDLTSRQIEWNFKLFNILDTLILILLILILSGFLCTLIYGSRSKIGIPTLYSAIPNRYPVPL